MPRARYRARTRNCRHDNADRPARIRIENCSCRRESRTNFYARSDKYTRDRPMPIQNGVSHADSARIHLLIAERRRINLRGTSRISSSPSERRCRSPYPRRVIRHPQSASLFPAYVPLISALPCSEVACTCTRFLHGCSHLCSIARNRNDRFVDVARDSGLFDLIVTHESCALYSRTFALTHGPVTCRA